MQLQRARCAPSVGLALTLIATAVACQPAVSSQPSPTSPTAEAVYATWTAITVPEPLPHVYGGSDVRAAVAYRGGFVAVGGVNGGCCTGGFTHDTHGVVWRSADGVTWELEANDAVFDLGRPMSLATDGVHLVAVGARMLASVTMPGDAEPHGAAWTSEDGLTWKVVIDAPMFTAVVAFREGFIASADGPAGPEIWRSSDGATWTQVAGAPELGPGSIDSMAVSGAGIVAVGRVDPVGTGSSTAVAWRSVDGTEWTRAPDQGWMSDAAMAHVAVSGGRLVAAGNGEAFGALWWSDDGLTWSRELDSPMGDPATSLSDVVAGDAGFILIGSRNGASESTPTLWTSPDGRSWTPLPFPAHLESDALAAVQAGDSLVVFGRQWLPDGFRALPVAWSVR